MNEYKNTLLISEDYIKSESFLDDNLAGKYILSAIKASQDIELRSIIGKSLLEAIQYKIYFNELTEDYKVLLDEYIQPFLLYQVIAEVMVPVAYKIANAGVISVSNEKTYNVDPKQIDLVREYYVNKANVYKKRLQNYVCKNSSKFAELNLCETNLYASDSSGIWLGGSRGRR